MSDIQLYLLEVDKNNAEARQIAAQSAAKLESKQIKLIDLITSLEEYINNTDDGSIRSKTVSYLADVLEQLPPKCLSNQERRLLCDFVLGRIEGDVEGIGASAKALLALEERGKWDTDTAQRVMRTFMDHAHPIRQFKLQTERYPVIRLIDRLLAKYRIAMKQIHEEDIKFLDLFVSFFEGEKDPRNLMIIFSLLQVPMAEWDIAASAQDMFDAVFNYFPITFKPPPDDPYGITAQDLKERLKDCIAANSDFAPYAFPALLDKLDSTSMNTKRDVLRTVQACVIGYGLNTINLYSVTLWDALKFEIINVQEEDLAEEALKALAFIAAKLAGAQAPLQAYLRPIIKECNEHLEDAPTKQSQGAGRILHAVSQGGPEVADRIAKGTLPVLFSLFQSSESITKRRGLLEVFNQIIKSYKEAQMAGIVGQAEALQAFADEALSALVRAVANAPKPEVSFRLTALSGLSQLASVRGALSDVQIARAVDAIDDVILRERVVGHGDISEDAIKSLIEVAHFAPDAVRHQAVPAFMVELPDIPDEQSSWKPILEAFAQLSVEQQMFDTVVVRIKNKLSAVRRQNASKEYQHALLLALLYAFTYGSALQEDGVISCKYYSEYAEPLIAQVRETTPSEVDDSTAEIVGRIANIVLRQQSPHFQSTVYNQNLEWLSHATQIGPKIVLRQLSLVINKFLEPQTVHTSLGNSGLEVEALLTGNPSSQKVAVAFAVVKALVIQGKSGALTSKYVQLLLQSLPQSDKTLARRFAGLLAPDDILTKENHCVVSTLSKQKTFNQIVPAIVDSVRTADPATKPKFLIALSGILRWLPYSIIESSLASLVPALLQSLDLNEAADQEVKYPTLTVFESLLMHDPDVAAEHTASLITRLLNSTSSPGNVAQVRAKALQCLALVPKQLKLEAVIPYRRPVVKKLLGCLDDGKRNVRHEAVKCRTAWLALEEANEDEE
ncbi:hypothetical protein DOTSEDRAFT_163453 [Dothistroma septosporum NZE10]|uniref:MMS19 nucleotide excision repair protein n=1 Tax=Dothistroma septosporum (strain NZE10 / CBS 128990) TaxID=675120 RepID=N1Q0Q1_DOTSN|nr:hypothetical protein DOTSEDRAFT_163453 [Dothistroma septosporum NZE10]